jgi:hypothetical protein
MSGHDKGRQGQLPAGSTLVGAHQPAYAGACLRVFKKLVAYTLSKILLWYLGASGPRRRGGGGDHFHLWAGGVHGAAGI